MAQPAGTLVVAAVTDENGTADLFLLRLDAGESLDPGFGTDGVVVEITADGEQAVGLARMLDGRLLVAGNTIEASIARFRADGAPQSTYGTAGRQAIHLGVDENADARALPSAGLTLLAGTRQSHPTRGVVARIWNGRASASLRSARGSGLGASRGARGARAARGGATRSAPAAVRG